MLENLLDSKLKKRLLNIFFKFPVRSFSVYELRHLSQGAAKPLASALREFLKGQVVSAAARGQQRYYRINPHFRFYGELKDLVTAAEFSAEDEVSRKLKKIPKAKLVILSGIFTLQPQLPVDVLVVGEGLRLSLLERRLREIEKLTGQEINYAFLEPAEYNYRRMMNDRLIRDILDYPHLVLLNNLKP